MFCFIIKISRHFSLSPVLDNVMRYKLNHRGVLYLMEVSYLDNVVLNTADAPKTYR